MHVFLSICVCWTSISLTPHTHTHGDRAVVDSWFPLSSLLPVPWFAADKLMDCCGETAAHDMFCFQSEPGLTPNKQALLSQVMRLPTTQAHGCGRGLPVNPGIRSRSHPEVSCILVKWMFGRGARSRVNNSVDGIFLLALLALCTVEYMRAHTVFFFLFFFLVLEALTGKSQETFVDLLSFTKSYEVKHGAKSRKRWGNSFSIKKQSFEGIWKQQETNSYGFEWGGLRVGGGLMKCCQLRNKKSLYTLGSDRPLHTVPGRRRNSM